MSFFHILLLAFLLVPLGEIYLLIQVGGIVGALPTVGLVVLTAFLGAGLMRIQGLSTLAKAQSSMSAGEIPATEMLEGVLILFAGALLLTPGFITDGIGFICLIPFSRQYIVRQVFARFAVRFAQPPGTPAGRIIDGEFTRREDESNSQ